MDRDKIADMVSKFIDMNMSGGFSDEEIDELCGQIEKKSPNSEFTGLVFYNERDRTPAEMADEMLLRESIYAEGGKEAVDKHIIAQMKTALDMPFAERSIVASAYQILAGKDPEAAQRYEHLIWPDGKPKG